MYRIRPLNNAGMDSSTATRAALIKAAGPIFAELGFEDAKTRDIAAKAKSNVSAINYHFGSKMGLYQAVIKDETDQVMNDYPLETPDMASGTPEDRFRLMFRNMCRRTLIESDPRSLHNLIFVREMAEPSPALDFLVEELARKQFETMRTIIADVVGQPLNKEELDHLVISSTSQCFHYRIAYPLMNRMDIHMPNELEAVDALADKIATFSLAGIRALYPKK